MEQIINYLRLSITDSDELSVIEAKQGDNQGDICQIEIYDNQDIVDLSQFDDILFTANKPDMSSVLFRLSDRKNLIKNNNTLSLTFTSTLLSMHGTVECELSFYKNDIVKSTYNFNIYIFKSPGSFDVMNNSDITTIKDGITEIREIKKKVEISEKNAKESEENAKTSENNAKQSEMNANASAKLSSKNVSESKKSADAAKISETNAKASESASANSEKNALIYANQASASKDATKTFETNAKNSETNAANSATSAKNYADSWKGSLLPQGAIAFSQLPTSGMIKGYMYCITNFFNTDSRFEEGADFFYPARTCVYWTENNKWKCLSGVLTREITQAEYDALSVSEQHNGTLYYISDGDNSLGAATSDTDGLMSATDKVKLDALGAVVTYTKTLTVGTDWIDTGIAGNNLSSGSYIVQISGMSSSATNMYNEIFTGIMSWFNSTTGSTNSDEILLHKAGTNSNGETLYLRTIRTINGYLKLQIASSRVNTSSSYTFKFRKLI